MVTLYFVSPEIEVSLVQNGYLARDVYIVLKGYQHVGVVLTRRVY